MNRITFAGKISSISHQQMYLDGTAMLIVIGVALDTLRQLPTQPFMRGYRGFIR
jgi:preprotein translocase subunit SecY